MDFWSVDAVADDVSAITSANGEIVYLIEGNNSAVLIDSGPGVGNLESVVVGLTDKPLTVLLTHGHVDHAMGAPAFDRVYMNHLDEDLYREQSPLEERQKYLRMGLGERLGEFVNLEYTDPNPEFPFNPLEEGMVFDLGGLHVEPYAMPGHTAGSMVILLVEPRILILGDSCNKSTFLFGQESSTVEEYCASVKRIRDKLEGRYDRVFISHHQMDVNRNILDAMLDVCHDIMSGNADDLPFEFMGVKAFIAKRCTREFNRVDGVDGNLVYSKDKIW